jgi:hypothetical protein
VGSSPTRRTQSLRCLYSDEEVARVAALAAKGLNKSQISRLTGISRAAILDWSRHGFRPRRAYRHGTCATCGNENHAPDQLPLPAYPYLLGLYLGDGTISSHARNVYRLRVCLDMLYPGIIAECKGAMQALMPRNVVNTEWNVSGARLAVVSCYSKSWPCLFPQHGPGMKHLRPIVLADWQLEIVDRDPRPLLRGLIHSDGCRVVNKSLGRRYLRYMFSNASTDILSIFCDACDQLGIDWTKPKERNISIARRESIALMDTFIGPKT